MFSATDRAAFIERLRALDPSFFRAYPGRLCRSCGARPLRLWRYQVRHYVCDTCRTRYLSEPPPITPDEFDRRYPEA
jgi:hypothetical protein